MSIYNKIEINSKNLIKRIVSKFNYRISRIPKTFISDKLVKRKIGKFELLMREDHQLTVFMKYQKYYSTNLPRLAVEVFNKYPDLKMIDIGANIGDTVALTRSVCDFPITCIDGDEEFFKILNENIRQFKNVKAYRQLLGDKDEEISAVLKKNIETARLQSNYSGEKSHGNRLSILTLDNFINQHKEIEKSKLLKIDTDGFDIKIVRGGLRYIENTKPIIFLEYDTVFFDEQGYSGIPTLLQLENMGYEDIIFYDNLGKLIISTKLSEHMILKQMNNLIDPKERTPFPYYDLAIFHKEDADTAQSFINKEMKLFYNDKFYAK